MDHSVTFAVDERSRLVWHLGESRRTGGICVSSFQRMKRGLVWSHLRGQLT